MRFVNDYKSKIKDTHAILCRLTDQNPSSKISLWKIISYFTFSLLKGCITTSTSIAVHTCALTPGQDSSSAGGRGFSRELWLFSSLLPWWRRLESLPKCKKYPLHACKWMMQFICFSSTRCPTKAYQPKEKGFFNLSVESNPRRYHWFSRLHWFCWRVRSKDEQKY